MALLHPNPKISIRRGIGCLSYLSMKTSSWTGREDEACVNKRQQQSTLWECSLRRSRYCAALRFDVTDDGLSRCSMLHLWLHSCRSASTGCTDAARRAGSQLAPSPTAISSPAPVI